MKLLLLFAVILVAGVFTQDLDEESEPSLCVEHQNPFAYTHCIKKRDAGCQNGGFCGTCNGNSCQTCNGNNCRTSCNGAACNQCPNGNCCDGQNCNVCSGRNCCSGSNCNSCVNSCNQGCSTPACRSTCFQTCQSNSCCDRSECFNSCRNQCYGDHCYETCFKQCPCSQTCSNPPPVVPVPTPGVVYPNISIPTPQPPQNSNQTIVVVNKPENRNPVNITTVVHLKNYINNKNIINTPINITNVNHNHINESQGTPPKPENIIDNKCCIVVYPVHCYDISEHPYKKCVQKREKKCGEICTSVVVHVVHVPGRDREIPVPYPVPVQVPGPVQVVRQPQPYPVPIVQRYPVYYTTGSQCGGISGGTGGGVSGGCGYRQICHYINRYPWISCGHYGVQNCGSCYVCGGQYNPGYCSQQVGCAGLCRGGIVNFGNTWQHDILRYAPNFSAQFAAQARGIPAPVPQQPQQAEIPLPPAQIVQQPQSIDIQQQAYAAAQQQQYMQQPAELGMQQQYPVMQGGIQQQPIEFQQHVVQQPIEFQQGGSQQQFVAQQPIEYQQQYVVQQPYEVQQPFGGVNQQFAGMQHPLDVQQPMQQIIQQPVHIQQQPAGFAGQ